MSWRPNDLVSDTDLESYEHGVLTQFKQTDWAALRAKVLEDWLWPILRTQGYDASRFRTRFECDRVWGYTASVYSDLTGAAKSATADDLDLAAIFATPSTDALYVGSTQQFRGLSIRMLAGVSNVTSATTVSYWADAWVSLANVDGTKKATGKAFSGGGAITWTVPEDWVPRAINGSARLYWVRLTVAATPTAGTACQIGAIRRSVLCAPVTFRTLMFVMREARTGGTGPWSEKADKYELEADAALQRALLLVAGEFDTDTSDQVSDDEADQTPGTAGGHSGGWRLERY